MDDHAALRAAHDRARAESCEILERLERNAAAVEVEARDDSDDALVSWSRGMPQPEPERRERRASSEKLTDSESARWQRYIDGAITAANAQRDKLWREVLGAVVAEVRKQMRAEIAGELAKLDLRLSALLAEVTKRQIESAAVFQLPRGAQRFTHGVNGNA
jgi:hypothetical protein